MPLEQMSQLHERRLGWNWLWFLPLCLLTVFLVEGHTIPYALRVIGLAHQRWDWGGLISPSAGFCFAVVASSVVLPPVGLLSIYLVVTSNDKRMLTKRYLYAFMLSAAILLLPLVADVLIWGSFPFTFDNAGVGRLRMIPFVPWPSGPFGQY